MSLNFVYHCATPGPWGTSGGVCPNQDVLSLGMGEYLDINNWSNGTPGVSGPANSTGPDGTTGTFEAAACHQRMYATLAAFFDNAARHSSNPLDYLEYRFNPYYYDSNPNNQRYYNNFSSANATFFNQNATVNPATPSSQFDMNATQTIHTIYSWDVERFQGQGGLGGIGSNPLHPTAGCT